ncbi:MAG: RluA family pseudouridine synthase [Saprospiraceae bacterium]|nr:RluA family pseudouridine synthase [Saprospiraceae bacterium]
MIQEPSILYEDKYILIIHKPCGMVCEAQRKNTFQNVEQWVLDYYKSSGQKAKNLIVGICHRLDRPVSGVMMIAKKPAALKVLNSMFQKRLVKKYYHALVESDASQIPFSPKLYHNKDEQSIMAIVSDQASEDSKPIKSEFECLEANAKFSIVKVRIITGKYHQIRASLSFLGHPVWNDHRYGGIKRMGLEAIGLQATQLDFNHPTTNAPMSISIENTLVQDFVDLS